MMKDDDSIERAKMDQLAFRVAYLIAGFLQENLTETEHQELDDWIGESMDNQRLFEDMTDPKNLETWLKWRENTPSVPTLDRLKSRLEFTPPAKKSVLRSFWPYVAAASILLGAAITFEWIQNKAKPENLVQTMPKDLLPGGNHAILTLSDGRTIALDSAGNGNLTQQGNVNIHKQDSGLISYQVINPSVSPGKEEYNTLTAPAGGQFRLILPDGSNVLLNAGSSLKYPTVFSGKKRLVILTGEGYFEVAKDPMFPFEVSAGTNTIQVLGTHFNINAYADEPAVRVTLEEGSVMVNQKTTLTPGWQAQISPSTEVKTIKADLETELAWKNDLFVFKQAPLDEVMRQVGRWYKCEVDFKTNITDHFNFSVSRSVPVSKLLHFLEETGSVHFSIEDKKITVMQ